MPIFCNGYTGSHGMLTLYFKILQEHWHKIKKEELAKGVYFLGIETDATTIIKKLTIH